MMKKLLLTGLALTLPLALTACGFTPMHTPVKAGATTALTDVRVELVEPELVAEQEASYFVMQHLRDRLGNNDGAHTLKITPRSRRIPYGVSSTDVSSRYDLSVAVDYELLDNKSGGILNAGKVRAITTFGSGRDPYARISSEKNASEQVARDAADRVLLRIATYYKDPERAAKKYNDRLDANEQRRIERAKELGIEYTPDDLEGYRARRDAAKAKLESESDTETETESEDP